MANAPVTTAPPMLWMYCQNAHSLSIRAQKLLSWAVPFGPISKPTGCCIQASVTMMKKPEIQEPRKTMTAESQWIFCPNLRSPKRKMPRKEDSRKKANTPSMASAVAMTPPEYCANFDQLVPNWNSMGTPVMTPKKKLIAKILAQKRAALLYCSSFFHRASDLKMTRS